MLVGLNDKELLHHKDERAFRVLFDRYWSALYKKAQVRLACEEDAKDIIQEIFISIWNNRLNIVIENTLAPYIFTALKFSIIKKIERDYRKGKTHPLNPEEIENLYLTSEEKLQFKELELLVNQEVEQLPERMKAVYILSKQKHLKNKEIAEILQISEQTVKNMLSTAVKKLRQKLSDYQYSIFLI